MPIVNANEQPPVPKPNTVRIAAPEYKGVTVDTRYIPTSALLTNIEGSAWYVNYYSQVLAGDSAVEGQNVNRNAIYQQYKLIKGFEFKVTGPLDTSQDNETKAMMTSGAANIYPFLIPNVGDMFLADIGDGREGLFKITNTERKSIFKDTCYAVQYQLIDYSTEARRFDLNGKVVQTLQFVKDFLQYGQNPLLQEEEFVLVRDLEARFFELITQYFRSFTSKEFRTLIMPGQLRPTYDHFLVQALSAVLSVRQAPELLNIRRMNVDGDDVMKCAQLWELLVRKDKRLIKNAAWRVGLVSARTFSSDPAFESIYYSGIANVVYPKDAQLNVDYDHTKRQKLVEDVDLRATVSPIGFLPDLLSLDVLNGLPYEGAPLIHQVTIDDYYVFSQAFYERNPIGQSKLELAVHDYLEGRPVSNKLLVALYETSSSWGSLERFYYIPILLILIKSAIRSL